MGRHDCSWTMAVKAWRQMSRVSGPNLSSAVGPRSSGLSPGTHKDVCVWWVPGWTREFLIHDLREVGAKLQSYFQDLQLDIGWRACLRHRSPQGIWMVKNAILRGVGARTQAPSGPPARISGVGWPDTWGHGWAWLLCNPLADVLWQDDASRAVAEAPGRQGCTSLWLGLAVCLLGMVCLFKTPLSGHGLY